MFGLSTYFSKSIFNALYTSVSKTLRITAWSRQHSIGTGHRVVSFVLHFDPRHLNCFTYRNVLTCLPLLPSLPICVYGALDRHGLISIIDTIILTGAPTPTTPGSAAGNCEQNNASHIRFKMRHPAAPRQDSISCTTNRTLPNPHQAEFVSERFAFSHG